MDNSDPAAENNKKRMVLSGEETTLATEEKKSDEKTLENIKPEIKELKPSEPPKEIESILPNSSGIRSPRNKIRPKTLSMTACEHPSISFIRPVSDAYKIFDIAIHEFARKCCVSETSPDLLNQLTILTKSFNHFINQCKAFYQGVNINPRGRTSITSSSIQKAARILIENWADFTFILNTVIIEGLSRFYPVAQGHFDTLDLDLDKMRESMAQYSFKTDAPAGSVRKMDEKVKYFKTRLQMLRKQCSPQFSSDIESGYYQKNITLFMEELKSFFRVDIPRQTLVTSDVLKIQSRLNISTNALEKITSAAMLFNDGCESAKKAVVDMNETLEKLLAQMEFPFSLKIEFACFEDEEEKKQEEKYENELSNQEMIKKIRSLQGKLRGLDEEISNFML